MRTALTIVIILAVIMLGGWLYFADTAPQQTETDSDANGTVITPEVENEAETDTDPTDTHTVTYTDDGFTPETVTIEAGETVRFVNESSRETWVGSDTHPTHTQYSGSTLAEHCDSESSGAFDQCTTGDAYTFTFDQMGEWGYHNHMRSSHGGTIIVE